MGGVIFYTESKRGVPTPTVAFTKWLVLYKIFLNQNYLDNAQCLDQTKSGEIGYSGSIYDDVKLYVRVERF
jgi:hypothetical protein